MFKFYLGLLGFVLFVSSCNVNKDFMFKTDVDYAFDTLTVDSSAIDFKLSPNDRLDIKVFTNEGNIIFEATTSRERMNINDINFEFLVQSDGFVELPILGRVSAEGKTIREFQDYLEGLFSQQFVDPMAIVSVLNRRAIVFNGRGSAGSIVPLINNNMRLIEVIGAAGGIQGRGNASRVKIIRNSKGEDHVYLVDLSTIEGIDQANMIIENGDIVYIESTKDRGREILAETTPIISLFTSFLLLANLFVN
jgi:polysaccharide biosynthesis/export protein